MRKVAYVLGGLALGVFLGRLFRRRRRRADADPAQTVADPRAEGLRRRLAASRERAAGEARAAPAPGPVGESQADVDAARRRVHERGRKAADEMRGSGD